MSIYPGGSRSRVNKAGCRLRENTPTAEDVQIIDEWRAAHKAVLNTFQAILRNRTKGKEITVSQRHKRKNTILGKLNRFPSMELSRMDDIAGCRLIFNDIESLNKFRSELHRSRFKHELRNEKSKYNYIHTPKDTGYRGIHDIYVYKVNSKNGAYHNGLYVEIQYRTKIQHSWATAVEIIGFLTESQPKFQKGDKRYTELMSYASEILARAHEQSKGPHPDISSGDLVVKFSTLEADLRLMDTLVGIKIANTFNSQRQNIILVFDNENQLQIKSYADTNSALKDLFRIERENPSYDAVLVKAEKNEDIRLAFKNYFLDAYDFVDLIRSGIVTLMNENSQASTAG